MKIYFATTGTDEPRYLSEQGFNILMSFFYYKNTPDLIRDVIHSGVDVFIDSGAFSGEVDIVTYCKFLKDVGAKKYANLDVIGNDVETHHNYHKMRKEYGLDPMPVFHTGEKIEYLYEYLDNSEYLALGGAVQAGNLFNWLMNVWNEILKRNPKIKVHGFGITSQKLVSTFPWHSIDSSSFKAGKIHGRLTLFNDARKEMFQVNYNKFLERFAALCFDDRIIEDRKFQYEFTDVLAARAFVRYVEHVRQNVESPILKTRQLSIFDKL